MRPVRQLILGPRVPRPAARPAATQLTRSLLRVLVRPRQLLVAAPRAPALAAHLVVGVALGGGVEAEQVPQFLLAEVRGHHLAAVQAALGHLPLQNLLLYGGGGDQAVLEMLKASMQTVQDSRHTLTT